MHGDWMSDRGSAFGEFGWRAYIGSSSLARGVARPRRAWRTGGRKGGFSGGDWGFIFYFWSGGGCARQARLAQRGEGVGEGRLSCDFSRSEMKAPCLSPPPGQT